MIAPGRLVELAEPPIGTELRRTACYTSSLYAQTPKIGYTAVTQASKRDRMPSGEQEKDTSAPHHPVTVNTGMALEFDSATRADANTLVEHTVFRPEFVEALILLAQFAASWSGRGIRTRSSSEAPLSSFTLAERSGPATSIL